MIENIINQKSSAISFFIHNKMCRKCGSKCNKDIYASDLYVCGDIYANTSTLFITTITTGVGVPVKVCSLATDTIVPCATGSPITINGSANITGDLTVA